MQGCRAFIFVLVPSRVLWQHCKTPVPYYTKRTTKVHESTIFYWLSLLHGWPEASLIPIKAFSPFRAAMADMSVHGTKWQGFVFVQRRKDCKRRRGAGSEEGGRRGGGAKWQEACSASMNSDWRADGPTGEVVVSLSMRLEYWYTATAALPTRAKPPCLFYTPPLDAKPKTSADTTPGAVDKTQHHHFRYKQRKAVCKMQDLK